MAGDADFDKVSLLLHFDGADNSTGIVDSGPALKTFTANGNAKITTAQSKFGGSALQLNGVASDTVTAPPDSTLVFGTGDFTIEFWALKYANGAAGYDRVIHTTTAANDGDGFLVELSAVRGFMMYGMGVFILPPVALNPNDGVWHHWAISRSSSTVRAFKDGVVIGSATSTANISTAAQLRVGARTTSGSEAYPFNGYIDDLRVTKGVARYTADFTPPSAPFPDVGIGYDIFGTVRDATNALAARKVAAYREDTNALVGTTTSDATTGAYSIVTPADTAHTLVFYPAVGENLNALVLRGVLPIES